MWRKIEVPAQGRESERMGSNQCKLVLSLLSRHGAEGSRRSAHDPNRSFSSALEPSSDIAPNLIGLEAERGRANDARQNRDVVEFLDDPLDAEPVHDAPGVQIDDHQRAARLGCIR